MSDKIPAHGQRTSDRFSWVHPDSPRAFPGPGYFTAPFPSGVQSLPSMFYPDPWSPFGLRRYLPYAYDMVPSGTISENAASVQKQSDPQYAFPIAFGKKVDPSFKQKVKEISSRLNLEPDHLMAVMAFETGRKFRADIQNGKNGPVGLLQFTKSTAKRLGTTHEKLKAMTVLEQLVYVEMYLEKVLGTKKPGLNDLYMAVHYPAAIGKDESHVLYSDDPNRKNDTYDANAGLDVNKDKKVTVGEAVSKVKEQLVEGKKPENFG